MVWERDMLSVTQIEHKFQNDKNEKLMVNESRQMLGFPKSDFHRIYIHFQLPHSYLSIQFLFVCFKKNYIPMLGRWLSAHTKSCAHGQ